MIKAVFFDVDGTLVDHSAGRVPESTLQALEALRRNGVLIALATGRHVTEFDYLPIRDLEFDGYVIDNGQICLDRNKNLLWGASISPEATAELVQIFRDKTLPLILVEANRMYINFVDDTVRSALADISSPPPPVEEYRGGPLYQATAILTHDQADWLARRLPGVKITWWHPKGIDIISQGGSKSIGIQRFLDTCHIPVEETMAFGDGENDMEMLGYVGLGVAMGNAPLEVQQVADYVTLPVDQDGIYHALRHFNLI